jgi:hypothetical protein
MFGASWAVKLPFEPSVTLFLPAATVEPLAAVKAGHEIKRVPEAGVPSALKTVSLIVVNVGDCDTHGDNSATSTHPVRKAARHLSRK